MSKTLVAAVEILLVEDDEEDYRLVRRWLADSSDVGFRLNWVSTPDEAREVLARAGCHLCLLDYRLGPHSGLDLLREAVARGWDVPIILLTGESASETGLEALQAGAADYLVKAEITAPLLVRSLRHTLERRRLLESAELQEEERRQTERALRAVISKARCLLWNAEVWDNGTEKLLWQQQVFNTDAAQRFLPLDLAEHLSYPQAWYASRVEADRERSDCYGSAQVRLGQSYRQEFRCRDRGGVIRWLVEDVQVEAVAPGQWHAVGVCTDITELRDVESQLRESLAILRAVTEGAADTIFVKDLDGQYLMINTAGAQVLGRSVEQVVGAHDIDLFSPATARQIAEHDREVLSTGRRVSYEQSVATADGTQTYHVTQSPRYGPDGTVKGVVGISRDITQRKQAEEALRASEERFRTLAEAMPQIVWITRPDGWNLYFSRQWVDYTGFSLEESQGHDWIKPFHPEDRPRAWEAWQHATATGGTYSLECRLRRADGVYRWWLVRGVSVRDPDGHVGKWIGTCTDIDDLKRAESERGELLAQLSLQVERMPLAYLLTDSDLKYTHWNPAAERMFGYTNAEVRGKHPFDVIVPAQSRRLVADLFARLAGGDMNAHGTAESLTKEGQVLCCEWHNTPLFGLDGVFQGILSLAQDVTARELSEQALHLRDRAIQAVSSGIVITDACQFDNPIIYASPGFEHLTGYTATEVAGWNCRFLQGKDTDPDTAALVHQAMHDGRGCTVEMLNYRKDGTPFWNHLVISAVLDQDGELTHYVGVQTDVTERRHLEVQLRQAQKMEAVGRLAGGVAHDFNNLLTVISGYSELILMKMAPSEPHWLAVAEIRKAGERAAGLTRQLLAFSRQQLIKPVVLDLNEVVLQTEGMLRRLIGEDITLTTVLDPNLPWVKADAGQIDQVIMNLCVNARDALPTGGNLTIETRDFEVEVGQTAYLDLKPGRYARLSITDSGCGMTPEVKAQIFEPFFTTKGLGHGTGLGLSTVFGIVKQSDGHVSVYSEVGVGTTFTVLFRATTNATTDVVESQLTPSLRGTETVLLVEDEAEVRKLTRIALEAQGYTVISAVGGAEALRKVEGHLGSLDLMVTDVVMPEMGGRQLADALRLRRPETKVLFMSGYTDDAVLRHGIIDATDHFLQKPFTLLGLAKKVRLVLDGSSGG